MGFSVTISGIIVISLLITTSLSMLASILLLGRTMATGINLRGDFELKKIASIMYIKNATIDNDNKTIHFIFSNNGSQPFYQYDKFDLIITYTLADSGERITIDLPYIKGWNITTIYINGGYSASFTNDTVIQPSMSASVEAILPYPAQPTKPIHIVFVNEYGSKAYYVFVGG
jgi:archaellum component FlaF (FlaF/FlaG flagellin family)